MTQRYIFAVVMMLLASVLFSAENNMKAFPPADEGMTRYVLQLPKQEDESAFRVELIIGKTVRIDSENRYFLGGKIEAQTIA